MPKDGTGLQPAERLPVAQALGETSVMLPVPVHLTLTEADLDRFGEALAEVIREASEA